MSDKAERAAPSAPDERDATIETLERSVADERQNSAMLRGTIEELGFKVDVLEKSYATQLADARLRSEDTMRSLTQARAELERVTSERDQFRKQLTLNDGRQDQGGTRDSAGPRVQADELAINDLIANSSAPMRQPAGGRHPPRWQVATDQESPSEILIAPELVFPNGYDEDDEP